MKILQVKKTAFDEVKLIKFSRFTDHRGYFTETYRKSIIISHPEFKKILKGKEILQTNESFSKKGVIRGMHFQWNPYMGKFIRVIKGQMLDLVLDIRKGSKNFAKMLAFEMKQDYKSKSGNWIWIPPGFAHGTCFLKDSVIEYLCTGEYNLNCERSISPLAGDINWSLSQTKVKKVFDQFTKSSDLIADKDKKGLSMQQWEESKDSGRFLYGKV